MGECLDSDSMGQSLLFLNGNAKVLFRIGRYSKWGGLVNYGLTQSGAKFRGDGRENRGD